MPLFLGASRKFKTARNQDRVRRQLRRARLEVESLEQRTLLSITFSGPNNSGLATITGTTVADKFVIQLKPGDATTIELSDNGGSTFVDAALAGITAINVFGLAGNDELVIDAANGLVGLATSLPITFDGGTGANLLTLQGTATGNITETFIQGANPGSGTLTMTDGTVSSTITLISVGRIHDTMTADKLTITGNDTNDFVRIHNGPQINGLTTDKVQFQNVVASTTGLDDENQGQGGDQGKGDDIADDFISVANFESISFANKTKVVVNGGAGNNLFLLSVGTAADGLTSLTINGGAGKNVAVIRSAPATLTLTLKNVKVVGTDSDAFFIEEMYEERLGRIAGEAELAYWMSVLQGPGGLQAVVTGIEESAEARDLFVKSLYERYLGRQALGGEEQPWVNLMLKGETEEQITAAILASPEFFAHAQTLISTGTPNQRYIEALYQLLLGRSASSSEVSRWVSLLPTIGRFGVAMGFLESNEFRTGVIISFYETFLERLPDPAGLAIWVSSGIDLEHIRLGFEESAEFFADS